MKYDKEIEEELNSIVIDHYLGYGIPAKPFYWYDNPQKLKKIEANWNNDFDDLEAEKYYQEFIN